MATTQRAVTDLVSALQEEYKRRPASRQTGPYDLSFNEGRLAKAGHDQHTTSTLTLIADAVGTVARNDQEEFSVEVFSTDDLAVLVQTRARIRLPLQVGKGTRMVATRFTGEDGNRTYTISVRPEDAAIAREQIGQ